MRKALALLVVVAVAAVVAGRVIPSTAVTAGASTLTTSELDSELQAISRSASFTCYLDARDFLQSNGQSGVPPLRGAAPGTWTTGAVVEWANIRTTQLLIDAHVARRDPSAFSANALLSAKVSLATAITQTLTTAINDAQSAGSSFTCPGEAAGPATIASLPGWFAAEEVRAQAGTLGLAALVPSPIPTAGAGLRAWYSAHSGEFDTTCLWDVQLSSQVQAEVVASAVDHGLSSAAAVARYSTSAQNRKAHGSIGCFSPTSPSWASVVQYVGNLAVGKATVASGTGSNGAPQYYVLGPTRRTGNSLDSILSAVQAQVRDLNIQSAQLLATSIQAGAHVSVTSVIGAWVPTSTGGTIVAPTAPPVAAILNALANTSTG
jgi:hypothetical protein